MRPVTVGLGGGEPRIRISPSQAGYGSSSPFLRGNAVKRSRKGLLRRRLKPVLLASVITLAPTMAMTWLMTSPRFAVRELSIVTGERVQESWVQEVLAPLVGQNLPRLPLARASIIHATSANTVLANCCTWPPPQNRYSKNASPVSVAGRRT